MRIRRKRKESSDGSITAKETAAIAAPQKDGIRKKKAFQWLFAGIIWLLSAGLAVAIILLGSSPILAGGVVLVGAVGGYLTLGRARKSQAADKAVLEGDFVEAFSYFSVYVQNGLPVYRALELTMGFASKRLAPLIQELIIGIDGDKSLRPYLEFADRFASPEIRQVMIAVERMVEEGGASLYVSQFRFVFASLAKAKRQERRDILSSRLSSLNLLPLLASGLTILLVTVAVLSMIGGYANGF